MSIRSTIAALAASGLIAATGAAMLTAPAQAAPNMSTYSVICADGSDVTVVAPFPPSGLSACAGHGYNGGAIRPKGPRIVTEQGGIRPDLHAGEMQAKDEGSASAAAATVGAASAVPESPDRPRGDEGAGDGLPVLNCSNSKVNPPSISLATMPGTWQLKNPAGSLVPLLAVGNVAWSAVSGAQWVGPGGSLAANGAWVYSRKVRINACPNGRQASLAASWRADNTGTLRVRDASGTVLTTGNQAGTPNYGFLPASLSNHTFVFPAGASGVYTIEFSVLNTSGPTGLAGTVSLSR